MVKNLLSTRSFSLLVVLLLFALSTISTLSVVVVLVEAKDCPLTGTLDGSGGCTTYTASAGVSGAITVPSTATGIEGIYFLAGGASSATFEVKGGASVSKFIFMGPQFSWSGGTIKIHGATTGGIVLQGTFTNNPVIELHHNTVTLDETFTGPAGSGIATLDYNFGIGTAAKSLLLKYLSIVGNTVVSKGTTRKLKYSFLVQGKQGDTFQASVGYALIYGNKIECDCCANAGMQLAIIPAKSTSNNGAYALAKNYTVAYNTVTVSMKYQVTYFDTCLILASSFVTATMQVEGNKCSYSTTSAAKVWNAAGIRLTVPFEIMFSYFGWSFRRCAEINNIRVINNVVDVQGGATSGVSGIVVDGWMSPLGMLAENDITAKSSSGLSMGLLMFPVCIGMHSRFSSTWGLTCFFSLGSCALPQATLTVTKNKMDLSGKTAEVFGFQFTAIAMRDNPPIFGQRIPIPAQYDFTVTDNDLTLTSVSSNKTRALYYGDHANACMPMAFESTGNKIKVTCSGTLIDQKSSCEGEALFQGLPTKFMVSMLKSFKPLQQGSAKFGDTIDITCQAGFMQCVGHNLALMPTMSKYPVQYDNMHVTQTELGDQNSAAQISSNAQMQRSAPLSFARQDVESSNPTLDVTGSSIKSSSFTLTRKFASSQISEPQTFRAVVRFDPLSRIKISSLPVTGCTFRYVQDFNSPASPSKPVALLLLPADSTAKLSLTASGCTWSHQDICSGESSCARGEVASPFRVSPGNPGSAGSSTKFLLPQATYQHRMYRKCLKYFNPPLSASCSSGCQLQHFGCELCSKSELGVPSSGWSFSYGVCPPPTGTMTPIPPAPSVTRQPSISKTRETHSLTRSITDEPTKTPEPTKTRLLTKTENLTLSRELTQMPPTRSRELSVSDSENTHSESLPHWTPTDNGSATEAPTRSATPSKSRPACPMGMFLDATLRGDGSAPTARNVERRKMRILLQLKGQQPLGPDDAFQGNISKGQIEIIDVPDAVPIVVDRVKVLTSRILEITISAPPDGNAFTSNFGNRFRIDPELLTCLWMDTNNTFESAAAIFDRRFNFAAPAAANAVLGLAVAGTYLSALFYGSSGISHWYAARRAVGFFDAVSCQERKDSLITIFDSPLQLEIGIDFPTLPFSRGAVIGNGIISVVICAAVLGASVYRSQTTWKPLFNREAMNWAGAPAFLMFPLTAILVPGAVQGAVEMMSSGDFFDIFLAIVFGLFTCATPLLVMYRILPRTKMVQFTICCPLYEDDASDVASSSPPSSPSIANRQFLPTGDYIDYNQQQQGEEELLSSHAFNNNNSSSSTAASASPTVKRFTKLKKKAQPKPNLLMRLFAPTHQWRTIKQHFVNRFGTAFERNTESLFYFTVLDVFLSILGGIFAGLPVARNSSGCSALIFLHVTVLIIGLAFACMSPFTVRFDNAALVLIYLLGMTNAIMSVIAWYKADLDLGLSIDDFIFAILVLLIVKFVVDMVRLKWIPTWTSRKMFSPCSNNNSSSSYGGGGGGGRRSRKGKEGLHPAMMVGPDGTLIPVAADDPSSGGGGGGKRKKQPLMTERELDEQRELASIQRQKILRAPQLPAPAPDEPQDLKEERKRRQQAADELLNQGLFGNRPVGMTEQAAPDPKQIEEDTRFGMLSLLRKDQSSSPTAAASAAPPLSARGGGGVAQSGRPSRSQSLAGMSQYGQNEYEDDDYENESSYGGGGGHSRNAQKFNLNYRSESLSSFANKPHLSRTGSTVSNLHQFGGGGGNNSFGARGKSTMSNRSSASPQQNQQQQQQQGNNSPEYPLNSNVKKFKRDLK